MLVMGILEKAEFALKCAKYSYFDREQRRKSGIKNYPIVVVLVGQYLLNDALSLLTKINENV